MTHICLDHVSGSCIIALAAVAWTALACCNGEDSTCCGGMDGTCADTST